MTIIIIVIYLYWKKWLHRIFLACKADILPESTITAGRQLQVLFIQAPKCYNTSFHHSTSIICIYDYLLNIRNAVLMSGGQI